MFELVPNSISVQLVAIKEIPVDLDVWFLARWEIWTELWLGWGGGREGWL
jgi:hypothetical protein